MLFIRSEGMGKNQVSAENYLGWPASGLIMSCNHRITPMQANKRGVFFFLVSFENVTSKRASALEIRPFFKQS